MWKLFFGAAALALLAATPGSAVEYPKQVTYLIYVGQHEAGKSVITIEQTQDALIFHSDNTTQTADFKQILSCRTEIDRKTFRAKRFRYEGERAGQAIVGEVWVEGNVFIGDITVDGNSFPSRKQVNGVAFFYQNFVIDNQIALLNGVVNADQGMLDFTAVFPSDFMFTGVTAFVESEIEFKTPNGPRICARVQFTMANSAPFWGYLDLDTGLPVYMDYPGSTTEVFLVDAYGEKPSPKYTLGQTQENAGHEGHNH